MKITRFQPENIRNFSIISHVDHGKTTLSDHLIASGGMLPVNLAGKLRALDFLESEQNHGITIETSLASFILKDDDNYLLINLIDTPGHVDFSGKVTEALFLVDNGLIVVDAVEGVMSQTRTVLRQAIREKLQLVLFINKIDRLITELQLDKKGIRKRIERIVGEIHTICTEENYKYEVPTFANNRVIIGSALDGWGVDIEIANEIGGILEIIQWYQPNQSFPKKTTLSTVFGKIINRFFVEPTEGQTRKFEKKQFNLLPKEQLEILRNCDPGAKPLLLTGKRYLLEKERRIGSVVRVLSGSVQKNMKLYSNKTDEWVEIRRISLFRGKKQVEVETIEAGKIVGIEFSEPLDIGDIISSEDIDFNLPSPDYIQEPVVAVSVEPRDFEDYDELISELELISKIDPGLNFEQNNQTGELIISGLGTFQIDLVLEELERREIEFYTSEPSIIEYMIPTVERSKKSGEQYIIELYNHEIQSESRVRIFRDKFNSLCIPEHLSDDVESAFKSEFIELMKFGPNDQGRIKDFHVHITPLVNLDELSYEDALVLANKILKEALKIANPVMHLPWFLIEIKTRERYVGVISNELLRFGGKILNIETNRASWIKTELPVIELGKLADTLRRVSDGNINWEIKHVLYRKK